jgi:hypothetical protein
VSISEHARANAPNPSPTVLRPRRLVGRDSEISDGKIVRFDQYVDSATINPIIGA